jgi:hypothetical protein
MLAEQLNQRTEGMLRTQSTKGKMLAESAQWKPFVEDMDDGFLRSKTAIVLENTKYWLDSLEETTKAISVGDFQKYAFPLVRAIFPELVANSLVSVQPMLGPVSLVFYLDYVYGTTKGSVTQGQKVFDSTGLGTSNPNYTSPLIDLEQCAVGNGGASYTPHLSFTPVRPGTVTITDGTQIVTDDGNGALIGSVGGASTIDYQTGACVLVFTGVVAGALSITATYEYDMEAQPNIPQLNLQLTSSPVMARPRKLKSMWSLEAAFNLRALHGLEAEVELTSAIGAEIRFEIDREIINDLTNIVPSANKAPAWSNTKVFKPSDTYSAATGATDTVGYTEHLLSINNQFVKGGNLIFKSTGRAVGQWIVMGLNVASIIETLPGFVATPGMPNGLTKGVYMAGTLNGRWSMFKDPFYNDDQWLMGFKGSTFLEAGYIYAPYIPLYTTPLIVLDDFIGRKGMASQYGKKTVNPRFYAKGQIVA